MYADKTTGDDDEKLTAGESEGPGEPESSSESSSTAGTTKFDGLDLKIKAIPTEKHSIPKNKAMENGVLPPHPFSMIINGSTGSGKSNFCCSLFMNKDLYLKYFHEVVFVSPTCKTDSIVKNLKLKDECAIDNISIDSLQEILDAQRNFIKEKGETWIGKNHRVCIIFDDIVGNKKLMNSKPFKDCFIANRHHHLSVIILTQSWRLLSRSIRLQANSCIFFPMSKSETFRICEDLCPAGHTRKEFEEIIDTATAEKYSFLHILNTQPMEERYRKNLDEIIPVSKAIE
jgi:hypothetical protein